MAGGYCIASRLPNFYQINEHALLEDSRVVVVYSNLMQTADFFSTEKFTTHRQVVCHCDDPPLISKGSCMKIEKSSAATFARIVILLDFILRLKLQVSAL